MALTQADVLLWCQLRERGAIPPRPRILEIGEANWYVSDDNPQPAGCEDADSFVVAKKFYQQMTGYDSIHAIDMNGTPAAWKFDLNQPLCSSAPNLPARLFAAYPFDIIINTGTAEHIFDQRQLFETIHDWCRVGGLMVHAAPWRGWINHGFYCYQPVFWDDLAKANQYQNVAGAQWGNEQDVMMYVALRKTSAEPFKVPMQGRYAG